MDLVARWLGGYVRDFRFQIRSRLLFRYERSSYAESDDCTIPARLRELGVHTKKRSRGNFAFLCWDGGCVLNNSIGRLRSLGVESGTEITLELFGKGSG